jgi:hypothetical protein
MHKAKAFRHESCAVSLCANLEIMEMHGQQSSQKLFLKSYTCLIAKINPRDNTSMIPRAFFLVL